MAEEPITPKPEIPPLLLSLLLRRLIRIANEAEPPTPAEPTPAR